MMHSQRKGKNMYKKYATATLVTYRLTLPTDLFEISAIVKGMPVDENEGMSRVEKLKSTFHTEAEKQLLYRNRILSTPVEGEAQPILQHQRHTFNVVADVLHIEPKILLNGDFMSKPWIQPGDIVIEAYTFENLEAFAKLIPAAVQQWGETDVRVEVMRKTAMLAASADKIVQQYSIITCSHVTDLYSFKQDAVRYHVATAQVNPFAALKLRDADYYLLEQKQVETLTTSLFKPEYASDLMKDIRRGTVEVPLFDESKDWMGMLRSRDNHFRSADDVFTRVCMPLAQYFNHTRAQKYHKVISENKLMSIESVPIQLFVVSMFSTRPVPCETCLVVNNVLVPVFFSTEDEDRVLNPFESLPYVLYRAEGLRMFSHDYDVQRVTAQPLENRNRTAGSYVVVGLNGITVYSLAGIARYSVTYAKLKGQALLRMEQALTA